MPTVLCCSGLDPGGGAGIHADIQVIGQHGAHSLALVTALTVQDSINVKAVYPVACTILEQQADALRRDCVIHAVKIGLIGDPEQANWLCALLNQLQLPTVLDPVLRAGGGAQLVGDDLELCMKDLLFQCCTIITPNAAEARRLAGCDDLDQAGQRLIGLGAENILITGGDEDTAMVQNRWYRQGQLPQVFTWPRLHGRYHGAGCTLAAAISAQLALGRTVEAALYRAQQFTFHALERAYAVGRGRLVPDRTVVPAGGNDDS